MKHTPAHRQFHAAIYTRKSSEEGLEQSFNSLTAQREACEAYIKSQQHEGWTLLPTAYDDGGYSGGNTERPALTQLLKDIERGEVDVIVVYKVDRLSRSLTDFVRLIDLFDAHKVSFVSVTQQFNTSTSMGRLTLNVLLSFAQFEREVTSERIRDKIAASKRKGMWMGGRVPLGYDVINKTLEVNAKEKKIVTYLYERYLALGCVKKLKEELDQEGIVSKARRVEGKLVKGQSFSRGALYTLLRNPLYIGKVNHRDTLFIGQHDALISVNLWEAVQQRLEDNRHDHSVRVGVKDPSLLSGFIYDDKGHLMSPAHARKDQKRYRYYVSQAVMQYRETEGGSVLRIAANVIEELVVRQLRTLLATSHALKPHLECFHFSTDEQKQIFKEAESWANRWETLSPSQHISFLKKVINKIEVGRKGVVIHMLPYELISCLLPQGSSLPQTKEQKEFIITLPATLKRCGIETKLILSPNEDQRPHARTVNALQGALCKALAWQEAFTSGKIPSLSTIARQEHVTQRRIAHLLRLAYLAPDIMEAILAGKVPLTLTLSSLKNSIPLDWQEQRKTLGFGAT